MNYEKLTILPDDDVALAHQVFQDLVHKQPFIVALVFGSGQRGKAWAEKFTLNAGAQLEPYHVLWIRNPGLIGDLLKVITDGLASWDGLGAVVLNRDDRVCAAFQLEEEPPKHQEILDAFLKGWQQ